MIVAVIFLCFLIVVTALFCWVGIAYFWVEALKELKEELRPWVTTPSSFRILYSPQYDINHYLNDQDNFTDKGKRYRKLLIICILGFITSIALLFLSEYLFEFIKS